MSVVDPLLVVLILAVAPFFIFTLVASISSARWAQRIVWIQLPDAMARAGLIAAMAVVFGVGWLVVNYVLRFRQGTPAFDLSMAALVGASLWGAVGILQLVGRARIAALLGDLKDDDASG